LVALAVVGRINDDRVVLLAVLDKFIGTDLLVVDEAKSRYLVGLCWFSLKLVLTVVVEYDKSGFRELVVLAATGPMLEPLELLLLAGITDLLLLFCTLKDVFRLVALLWLSWFEAGTGAEIAGDFSGIFFTVLQDVALLIEDRELRKLVRELLRSTSLAGTLNTFRRLGLLLAEMLLKCMGEVWSDVGRWRNELVRLGNRFRETGVIVVPPPVDELTLTDLLRSSSCLLVNAVCKLVAAILFVNDFFFDVSLPVVAALSDEIKRFGFARFVLAFASCCWSAHEELLSLPWDGVSETRLCVSSNPSSFNSLVTLSFVAVVNSRGGLQLRSGVGDFRLRIASLTSSWLILDMLRPIFPTRSTILLLTRLSVSVFFTISFHSFSRPSSSVAIFLAVVIRGTIMSMDSDDEFSPIGEIVSLEVGDFSSVPVVPWSVGRLKRLVRRAEEWRSNWPSPNGSISTDASLSCAGAVSTHNVLCNGRGATNFLHGVGAGFFSMVYVRLVDGGVSMLSESISILFEPVSSVVQMACERGRGRRGTWVGVGDNDSSGGDVCINKLLAGIKLECVSINDAKVVLESCGLVSAAVGLETNVLESHVSSAVGFRIYNDNLSVEKRSPSDAIIFFRLSSSTMECNVALSRDRCRVGRTLLVNSTFSWLLETFRFDLRQADLSFKMALLSSIASIVLATSILSVTEGSQSFECCLL
jgi:hypothetical protein